MHCSVWSVQKETAPWTSGGSILRDWLEHWFSSDTELSPVAPKPFLSHTLITAFAVGETYWGAGTFLTTSSRRLRKEMGASKLSLSPLKGHEENTAKTNKQTKKPDRWKTGSTMTTHPTVRLQGGGDKCATGAKTTIRLPKEGTTVETWKVRSLRACGPHPWVKTLSMGHPGWIVPRASW